MPVSPAISRGYNRRASDLLIRSIGPAKCLSCCLHPMSFETERLVMLHESFACASLDSIKTGPAACLCVLLWHTGMSSDTAAVCAGVDGASVARKATECYLMQVLQHGFLHSGVCVTSCMPSASGAVALTWLLADRLHESRLAVASIILHCLLVDIATAFCLSWCQLWSSCSFQHAQCY